MSHHERDIVPGKRSTPEPYVGRGPPSSPSQRLHPQLGFPRASQEALAQREIVRVSRRTLSPMQSSPGGIAQGQSAPSLGSSADERERPSKRARFNPIPDGRPSRTLSPMPPLPLGRGAADGTHGSRRKEQKFFMTTGASHESEHTIGYAVAHPFTKRSSKEGGRLERNAPAYQEVRNAHRGHVGTGSGQNADEYRAHQRVALVANGADGVSIAVQLNQLEYGHQKNFRGADTSPDQAIADKSYARMVGSMRTVHHSVRDGQLTAQEVSGDAQREMLMARQLARNGDHKMPIGDQIRRLKSFLG